MCSIIYTLTMKLHTIQLVLPQVYHTAMLQTIHDDYGHQGLDWTLSLAHEIVYWSAMYWDVSDYFTNYPHCQIAKVLYVGPNTQPGSLVANKTMELLCIDFLEVDPSWEGKENVFVLTNAFSKFSQAFVTPNQKALTIAKVLVDKWFCVYNIPTWIHSDKGHSFQKSYFGPVVLHVWHKTINTILVVIWYVNNLTIHC